MDNPEQYLKNGQKFIVKTSGVFNSFSKEMEIKIIDNYEKDNGEEIQYFIFKASRRKNFEASVPKDRVIKNLINGNIRPIRYKSEEDKIKL